MKNSSLTSVTPQKGENQQLDGMLIQNANQHLQEFKHSCQLLDRGVAMQEQPESSTNISKGFSSNKNTKNRLKLGSQFKKVGKAINFLEIFDDEKELKARFKARHI